MSRDALKLGLVGCVVLHVITTILSFTGWRYRMPGDDDVLFFLRAGSFLVGIGIAVWLAVTQNRSAAN
jgi:hypothetical protein